jgi:ATP-dependent Lon protease
MAKKTPKKPPIVGEDDSEALILTTGETQESPPPTEELSVPEELAVLPIREMVIYPGMVVPLSLIRETSRKLISTVLPDLRVIACICQKDSEVEDPSGEDLYDWGTAVAVLRLMKLEDDQQGVIVHGVARIRVKEWLARGPFLRARVERKDDRLEEGPKIEALQLNVRQLASRAIELSPNIPSEASSMLENLTEPGSLADFMASNLQLDVPRRQELLEELDVETRLRRVSEELQKQIEVLELSSEIHSQVKESIDKTQRRYYLQEQLKAIQKELGQGDEQSAEIDQLRARIDEAQMPDAVESEATRELDRMATIPPASPEYNVIRTYLDVMTELPWAKHTADHLDVNRARAVLDADHYDLDKVKRRLLEYLAVRKLAPDSRGPILCFVGPPGVGKTSLGQSIARALGRTFIRMSLGGMRDEAELRGHRRTYIGAMPGRIIQEIRKAGTRNPVFMLDELDKVGADVRGDPTSALLEILDPAQNGTFQDNYLNVPFDLSDVMFIGTANHISPVPAPLRDRMEVIEIPGYTEREKLYIARRYLVPRQREQNGLTKSKVTYKDEALRQIIQRYTREAGVRELERQIGAVARGVAALIASGKARSRTVNAKLVREMLGPAKYESELALRSSTPGVATGLAYTPTGGEILFIEAASYPGKGNLMLTGQIGDVMKESAQTALSLVKSRCDQLGIDPEALRANDLHLHVPAGAVPKDGPSAGVAMFIAVASLMTGRTARPDVAMTGEITLRGIVLPIGGVKEKTLAAARAGIKTVILPERNGKDLEDIPPEVRKKLRFEFAQTVEEVLATALPSRSTPPASGPAKRARKPKSPGRTKRG